MPRPKRTKIASSVPASRIAASAPASKSTLSRTPNEGDSSDRGEKTIDVMLKPSRISVARSLARQSVIHSPESAATLKAMEKRRDEALARLDAVGASTEKDPSSENIAAADHDTSSSPAVEHGRRMDQPMVRTENSVFANLKTRRRPRQQSILGRSASRARSSSVESNAGEDTGAGNLPRMQNRNSFLGGPPSRARSSSIGLEMGRRRKRFPSILGTAKKGQSMQKNMGYDRDQDEDEDDDGEEEEDDFNPEDESTPLNLSKARAADDTASRSLSSALNSRKRKLSSVSRQSSSPPQAIHEALASSSPIEAPEYDHGDRFSTPEQLSETMAPPHSSSPAQPSPLGFHLSRRTNAPRPVTSTRRQAPRKIYLPPNDSPPSSPPSLTHSPNASQPARKHQSRKMTQPAGLSTIELQALLPRRRNRTTHDPFEVESSEGEFNTSGLASDDDELTNLNMRSYRNNRRPTATPARQIARLKPGPQTKSVKKAGVEKSSASIKKTYASRRASSDKENDGAAILVDVDDEGDMDDSLGPIADLESENSQELEKRVGTELKIAKRKFEVVDQWEMEFEDVTASSSSPRDAR